MPHRASKSIIQASRKYNVRLLHFLTLVEVQLLLGIKSRKTVLKYIHLGDLPAYKLGGTRWRISKEDVESFLKKHKVRNRKRRRSTLVLTTNSRRDVEPGVADPGSRIASDFQTGAT